MLLREPLDFGTMKDSAFGESYAPGTTVGVEQRYDYGGRSSFTNNPAKDNRWRTNNTGIGRFEQRDPKGYNAGIDLYLYTSNRPIISKDPFGLWTWIWEWNSWGIDESRPYLGLNRPGTFRVVLAPILPPDPTQTEEEQAARRRGQSVNAQHADLYYNYDLIYKGAWGPANENEREKEEIDKLVSVPLKYSTGGTLKYGPGVAGKCCTTILDDDIKTCLKNRPSTATGAAYDAVYNNCQNDVQGAGWDCCLWGYETQLQHFINEVIIGGLSEGNRPGL